jgi:hypothetical protein
MPLEQRIDPKSEPSECGFKSDTLYMRECGTPSDSEKAAAYAAYARDDYDADGSAAPPEVRERWAVNFIRHELTQYDSLLVDEIARQLEPPKRRHC